MLIPIVIAWEDLPCPASSFTLPGKLSPEKKRSHYGGLNENDSHRLIYFSAWSPVDESVWGRSGDVPLLEEVCHWEWALGFQS